MTIPAGDVWLLIGGLGILTYLIRFSFLGLLARRRLPQAVREALGFVPVAVLPAIAVPMVLIQHHVLTAEPKRIVGAVMGLALGAAFRDLLAGIVGAMAGFLILSFLGF